MTEAQGLSGEAKEVVVRQGRPHLPGLELQACALQGGDQRAAEVLPGVRQRCRLHSHTSSESLSAVARPWGVYRCKKTSISPKVESSS